MKRFRTRFAQFFCHQYAEQAKQHKICENFLEFFIFIELIQNLKFHVLHHVLITIRNRTRVDSVIVDFAHLCNDELISIELFANCETNYKS